MRTTQEHADALWAAERTRRPIAPLTESDRVLTVQDAYAVQRINVDRRLALGRSVRGHKVGLSSKATQQAFGVFEPDYGVLLDDMFCDEGEAIPMDTLIQTRIEAEIGVIMDWDLGGPGVTTAGALQAIGGAVPALEIVDSRIEGWRISLIDTVADNASSAGVAIGGKITPLEGIDLRTIGGVLSRNGQVVETGAGAAAMGNPARSVAWLANKLGESGERLRAGDIVLTGALHRAVAVERGDVFRAEFGYLGCVTARFV